MAFISRYTGSGNIKTVFIGNTLGLSKKKDMTQAGTLGSIGCFTSLNTSLNLPTYPLGTTLDYTKNGSNAILTLPTPVTILYAELVWGGLYKSLINDISSVIDNAITFTTPTGTNTVTADTATKNEYNISITGGTVRAYTRSKNVTSILQATTAGTFSVENVPALIEPIDTNTNMTNHAGWTLAVVYSSTTIINTRNVYLYAGGVLVHPNTGLTNVTINSLVTPSVDFPVGKIFLSAQEGDAVITGDEALFGESGSSLQNLSGTNNPEENFFASQINDSSGVLDTTGTFGTRNADAAAGINTSACRQGWDITAVDLTNILVSGQSSALLRFTSDEDIYMPNCIAIQIDSESYAELDVVKEKDRDFASSGEEITYTMTITNTGTYALSGVTFVDAVDSQSTFKVGSVTINATSYPTYDPNTGFLLPDLNPGDTAIVIFIVIVN